MVRLARWVGQEWEEPACPEVFGSFISSIGPLKSSQEVRILGTFIAIITMIVVVAHVWDTILVTCTRVRKERQRRKGFEQEMGE